MDALTEESLNKLNKPDLVALVVNLQSKMDSVISDLVAELSLDFQGFVWPHWWYENVGFIYTNNTL